MKWIQSTDLVQWAGRKECEGKLPELIRKLIISTCPTFPDLSIPSGDSVFKPGWDGQCKTEAKYGYVPEGISLWEFGRDEDFKAKCNREYRKRTEQTSESERLNSTFVFVTPHRWVKNPLKSTWIKTKKKANEWKDVIIYDADDLECWLEQKPAIGYWLAKELEKFTDGVESAVEYWNQFIANGEYILLLI
jgi:hypothetical protein